MSITVVTNVAVPDAVQVTGWVFMYSRVKIKLQRTTDYLFLFHFVLLALPNFALNSDDAFTNFTLMQFDANLPSGQRIFHNSTDKKKD